jgi:hypothetical protein
MSTTRAAALRHSILATRDFKIAPVVVTEWSLTVHVRTMSILETLAFELAREKTDPSKVVPLLLSFVLCDADGDPVFEQGHADCVDELSGKDAEVLSTIFRAALALTGTTDDDEASAEDSPEKP